jgi:V8-like Glu-specific endopeptidase
MAPSGASAAAPPAGGAHGTPPVTAEAWQAGRAAVGQNATAAQAVSSYWTPERMRAAQPVEDAPFYKAAVAKGERQAAIDQGKAKRRGPDGAPFSVPPAESTAGVEAAYNPNLPSTAPTAKTMGKVFFTKGGANMVCSAIVLSTEGLDAVWTAGHCIHGGAGGTYHSNWAFVPAYDDDLVNPRPYGTWTAWSLNPPAAWRTSSSVYEDMGMAAMNMNFGWHIASYLGSQVFIANQGMSVFEDAFGYPAKSPFEGGNLFRCWGTSAPEYAQTIKIPCDMTRGSSGGGWLRSYNGNTGYLNGVVSRINQIVGPTVMMSPYFDNTALDLYNATRYL